MLVKQRKQMRRIFMLLAGIYIVAATLYLADDKYPYMIVNIAASLVSGYAGWVIGKVSK